jgi:quercetin dioxygenase-like cupin family protein
MTIRKHLGNFTWDNTDRLNYKETGTHFKDITRQVLFPGSPGLPGELRYFEIAPGGHSTLERHVHEHVVMVIRGSGQVLAGTQVEELNTQDVVTLPPKTWHQFQATRGEALGFLCLVPVERDRPERPGEAELAELRLHPDAARFLKT